jgi:septal ring factor EnvC (AmiA/AmiB activator)
MTESALDWLKGVSSLISALIGIIGLFGAAGGLAVLFYRVGRIEKTSAEKEESRKKDISRLHERLDKHEEENRPLRDAINSMQTDVKWIKKHLASLGRITPPDV